MEAAVLAKVKLLSLNDVRELIKSGVSSNRIVHLVEQYGVNFEIDARVLRALEQDGASDSVVAELKKTTDRYHEDRHLLRRQQEERARKRMDGSVRPGNRRRRLERRQHEMEELQKKQLEEQPTERMKNNLTLVLSSL
jgi:hypothetical protein